MISNDIWLVCNAELDRISREHHKLVETFHAVSKCETDIYLETYVVHTRMCLHNDKDNFLTISVYRVTLVSADRLRPTTINRDRTRL